MTMQVDENTAAQAEKTFQEKMKERMRAAMGDLMPDEVLAGIVAKGIEEAFFKKQQRPDRRDWGSGAIDYPSWLVEHVQVVARAEVEKQTKQWFVDNHERVAEVVRDSLAGGIVAAVARAADNMFQGSFLTFAASISQQLANIRGNNP